MSIQASVGISIGEDSYAVGANACQDAIDRLGGAHPGVFIVFASSKYDQEKMLAGVKSVAKDTLVVGCSTAGEISTSGPVKRHSVVAMALVSDTIKFYGGIGENIKDDPKIAGKKAADEVKFQTKETLKAFM